MIASISLPVGVSSACSVIETTRTPLLPEHGLEGHGVLPPAGEAAEFPDQYLLEGGIGSAGGVDHLAELGPVGDLTALGLVHVLTGDDVAVLVRVVPAAP